MGEPEKLSHALGWREIRDAVCRECSAAYQQTRIPERWYEALAVRNPRGVDMTIRTMENGCWTPEICPRCARKQNDYEARRNGMTSVPFLATRGVA